MKMLFYAFSLSFATVLSANPSAAQNPAPSQKPDPWQPTLPLQGPLKLDRKPLPLTEGPGYFKTFPPAGAAPSPDARNRIIRAYTATHRLRLMSPDNMSCIVPNLARLEKMPISRPRPSQSRDRMPIDPGMSNPAQRPRIKVLPNP